MAAGRSKNSSSSKRTYKNLKDHGNDLTYENELNKFFDDLANNTPNAEQFEEEDLGKTKNRNRKSR